MTLRTAEEYIELLRIKYLPVEIGPVRIDRADETDYISVVLCYF